MEKLTNKEEEIMQALWQAKKAFVKEVVELLPSPKPHYNTVSTIIRILQEKGYVGHKSFGKSHQYYPIVSQEDYKNQFMNGFIDKYFSNSYKDMVTFFAQKRSLSAEDLKEILKEIENGSHE